MTPRAVVATAVTAVFALTASAAARSTGYVAATMKEPPAPGLAVTGPLEDYVVTSNARVVVPTAWQRRSAPTGRLAYRTTQNSSCRYDLTYRVKSVLGAPGSAAAYATKHLPAQSARHLLDSGQRGNSAFRVVRESSIGSRVHVDAIWAGVLTRRADVAPSGQVAWSEIRVSARSRKGDECHAGTWRESLGPAIGDSLAVARTTLHFTKKS